MGCLCSTLRSLWKKGYTKKTMVQKNSHCIVWRSVHHETGQHVYIKEFRKSFALNAIHEVHHLRNLVHPHIVQIYDVIKTNKGIISIITPDIPHSIDLFFYSCRMGGLNEDKLRLIFRQIVSALIYMKTCFSMTHGDISPENIVIVLPSHRAMLIDFGDSECISKEKQMGEWCCRFHGKESYMPPERWHRKAENPFASDVWSLAVCMVNAALNHYLYNMPDFDHDPGFRNFVMNGLSLPPSFSSTAQCLLQKKMLHLDFRQRPTVESLLLHPWFSSSRCKHQTHLTKHV